MMPGEFVADGLGDLPLMIAIVVVVGGSLLAAMSILYGAGRSLRRRGYTPPVVGIIVLTGTTTAGLVSAWSFAYLGGELLAVAGSFIIFTLGAPLAIAAIASALPSQKHRPAGTRVIRCPVHLLLYAGAALLWVFAGLIVAIPFLLGPGIVGENHLIHVVMPIAAMGAATFAFGRRAAAQMHAPRSLHAVLERDRRPPVLYLREFAVEGQPFVSGTASQLAPYLKRAKRRVPLWLRAIWGITDMVTVEDYLTGEIERALGPLVALGNPEDYLQPLGAAREYARDQGWQERFACLAEQAQAILLVPGQSANLEWELGTLRALGLATRLFVVVGSETFSSRSTWFHRRVYGWHPARWETFRAQMEASGYAMPGECPRALSVIGFDVAGRADVITNGGAISPEAYVHAVETHLVRHRCRQAVLDSSMDSTLGDRVGREIQEAFESLGVVGIDPQSTLRDEAFLVAAVLLFQAGIMISGFDLIPAFARYALGLGWSSEAYVLLAALSGMLSGMLLSVRGRRLQPTLSGAIASLGALLSIVTGLTWLDSANTVLFFILELLGILPGLFVFLLLGRRRVAA